MGCVVGVTGIFGDGESLFPGKPVAEVTVAMFGEVGWTWAIFAEVDVMVGKPRDSPSGVVQRFFNQGKRIRTRINNARIMPARMIKVRERR